MVRTRISYKIFFAFSVIIAVPILAISAVLGGVSGSVEQARQNDRFEYARAFIQREVEDRQRYSAARAVQLSEDTRLSKAILAEDRDGLGGALSVLAAEYGLDGITVLWPDGAMASWRLDPLADEEAYATRLSSSPHEAVWADRNALRFMHRVGLGSKAELFCTASLGRDRLGILKTVLGAEIDLAKNLGGGGYTVALSTRIDAYGRGLEGSALRPFVPLGDGESIGTATEYRDETGNQYAVRAIRLPAALSANYLATVAMPVGTAAVSEVGAYLMTFSFATLMLAAAASFLLARQLVQPVRALLRGVEDLSGKLEEGAPFEPIPAGAGDEIGELTDAYNRMGRRLREALATLREQNEELRQLDRIKDDFLANTSTEIRTPLNAIVGLAESMEVSSELKDDYRRTVGLIARTGRKLYAMVDDILDYSRLEHGDVHLAMRDFELRSLVDMVVRFCSGLKRGDVELFNLIEPGTMVSGDPSRVEQILYNLVGNAVKYTVRGSVIVRSWEEGGRVAVSVNDTGPGMASRSLAEAMAPFGEEGASAGMGLRIARRLAQLHGGELAAESGEGTGTTVSFTLPVAAEPEAGSGRTSESRFLAEQDEPEELETLEGEAEPPREGLPRYRILAVDDDPVSLRMLSNGLRDRYEVATAADGAEALRRMGRGQGLPDLILLGTALPKVSGFEICSMIRREHPAVTLPIVMITARSRQEDLAQAFSVGANDYVSKPISLLELRSRVKMHIDLAKMNEAYGRFVPRALLEHMGKESILDARLGDHVEGEMTLLASDLRNFTQMSEALGPGDTFIRLNEYYRRVSPLIRLHRGFIDKYLGDAILAIFPRSPLDAVEAALDIRREIATLNAERAARREPAIEAGIGVHTGKIMLGVIGEDERMDGTVISDAVNAAFKLEELTKTYGAKILVSGAVIESMDRDPSGPNPGLAVRHLGFARIKGSGGELPLYEVMIPGSDALADAKIANAGRFERAVTLFAAGDTEAAYTAFMELGNEIPEDLAWRVFMDRILAIRGYPGASAS